MTFSSQVKSEISENIITDVQKYACFYGMILFCRHFTADTILFQTENKLTADMFKRLSDCIIGRKNTAQVSESSGKYKAIIGKEEDREEIIYKYHIYSKSIIHRIQDDILNENNISPFIAGAFLSCGSMTEPSKEYHLEFDVPFTELGYDMLTLFEEIDIKAKIIERKNDSVIYIKDSESIEDILTFMGAPKSSIDLMNIKILKDIRNKTNRITNCDNANIERTLKASEKQIEDIEYIDKAIGLSELPADLQEIAETRLDNPEVSLKDLGEMLSKPLGRSGANHRLKRISDIAEKLREERGEI